MGEVQALKATPSRLQLKDEFGSLVVKLKPAFVLLVNANGPEVMFVSGGVLSIETVATEVAELEDASTAVAAIVAEPSGREAEFQSKL